MTVIRHFIVIMMISLTLWETAHAQPSACRLIFEDHTHFVQLTHLLQQSQMFRLLHGKEGEKEISQATLKPGLGYTVIADEGKIILGDQFFGGLGTTSGAHSTLRNQLKFNRNERPRPATSAESVADGAIRFWPDGTVDIAGYHRQEYSISSAREIARFIKQACPLCPIRLTKKKLSDLSPLF